MNETVTFSTCITCLTTNNNRLIPMSADIKNEYMNFVGIEMMDNSGTLICTMCSWQFRRHMKFKRQCQTARTLLEDTAMDFKYHLFQQELCINLERTATQLHYFKETLNHTRKKNHVKSVNSSIGNNSPVNGSFGNSLQVNGSFGNIYHGSHGNSAPVNGSLENNSGSFGNNCHVNGSSGSSCHGSSENMTEDIYGDSNNDDEIPLVKLKDKERKTKKRKKRKLMVKTDEPSNTVEDQRMSKPKKELKEGFTSRMVQETDEYVVIKLTKEQVLQEMEERSKTEAYLQSPFKCEKCVKGFNYEDVLQAHLKKHTTEASSFQCDMCYQYCRSSVSLRGHVKSHTTRYKCKLCGVVRLSRQHLLEHHAITHTRQPVTYSCDSCHFKTNKRTVMQRHVKSHAGADPRACEQCGKLFKSIDSLRIHTKRHDKSARLQCHCGVSFMHVSLLRRHVTRVHELKEYYCVECDAHFKSSDTLRLHFKNSKKHRDSSAYKHACPSCPVRAPTAGALCAHRAHAHGAARAHACGLCARRYCSRDTLRAHVWRAHAREQT